MIRKHVCSECMVSYNNDPGMKGKMCIYMQRGPPVAAGEIDGQCQAALNCLAQNNGHTVMAIHNGFTEQPTLQWINNDVDDFHSCAK